MEYRIISKNILSGQYEFEPYLFSSKGIAAKYALENKLSNVFILPKDVTDTMVKNQQQAIKQYERQQQLPVPVQYVETIDTRPLDEEPKDMFKETWLPRGRKYGPDKVPLVKPAVVGKRRRK
jgi:hypothetical protein